MINFCAVSYISYLVKMGQTVLFITDVVRKGWIEQIADIFPFLKDSEREGSVHLSPPSEEFHPLTMFIINIISFGRSRRPHVMLPPIKFIFTSQKLIKLVRAGHKAR